MGGLTSSKLITVRVGDEDYASMLALKKGLTWRMILDRGQGMRAAYPTRKEVQAMIDESILKAKAGY